jgi:threonine-phosphate decarboxylase
MSHGGRVWEASRELGLDHSRILDFSANMNPFGPPAEVLAGISNAISGIAHYPDAECHELTTALADIHGVDRLCVTVTNGAAEAIHFAPLVLGTKRGIILSPGFSDYSRALRAWGLPVEYIPHVFEPSGDRLEMSLTGVCRSAREGDTVFFSNPCNPTGEMVDRPVLEAAIETALSRGIKLVVDESFIEFAGSRGRQASVADLAASLPGVIVTRSFTKFYAIPGLRLGYAIAAPHFSVAFRRLQPSWTVNHIAQQAGLAALSMGLPDEMAMRVAELKDALSADLIRTGLVTVFPSACNFLLLRLKSLTFDAKGLSDELRSRGILIRDCSDFAGLDRSYVRVAVKLKEENAVLVRLLGDILGGKEDG